MRKTGTQKDCAHCGAKFYVPGWSPAKFCSMKCRRASEPSRVGSTCEGCGKTYTVKAYRGAKTRFCSRACRILPLSAEDRRAKKKASDREYYRLNKPKWYRYLDENREHIYAENIRRCREKPERTTEWNRRRRERHGEKLRAARRQHYRDNKVSYVANARKREMGKLNATPPWADRKAIEVFYQRAADLTERTGIKHHVDHIYPLRSKVMCGLHVAANLQIIPAIVNLRKSNAVGIPATPLCCAWPFVIDTGEIGSASYFARGPGEHRRRAG